VSFVERPFITKGIEATVRKLFENAGSGGAPVVSLRVEGTFLQETAKW
jgi:hypothetical protein